MLLSLNERRQLHKQYNVEFKNKKDFCFMYKVDYPHRTNIFNEFSKHFKIGRAHV